MFWSYRDSVQRSTSEKFILLEEMHFVVKCWKGQNHEPFKTTTPWGKKGKILCGGSFSNLEPCGLSEEFVFTYLSFSACDKPLAPGYLPKWRGLSVCLCREFCHSIPWLNKIIYQSKRGSAVRFPRLLLCTSTGTKALLCLCSTWTDCTVQPSTWRWESSSVYSLASVKDLLMGE